MVVEFLASKFMIAITWTQEIFVGRRRRGHLSIKCRVKISKQGYVTRVTMYNANAALK